MKGSRNIKVDFSQLKVGHCYSREYLANLWHYDGIEGISRGIVTVSGTNIILLFTTQEKDKHATQYDDIYKAGVLIIDGQKKHGTDAAILNKTAKIYSFFRFRAKDGNQSVPFTYQGEAVLVRDKCVIRRKDESPSKFYFRILSDFRNDIIGEIKEEFTGTLAYSKDEMSEEAQR